MGEFIPSPDARQQLLISKGEQQQLVWSVHLAGWLELGWQVAPPPGQAAPELVQQQQVPVAQAEPAAAARSPVRRGRRAASREPVAPAPEPVAPEPVTPGPVAPEPVAPEPVAPGPVAPEFEQPLAAAAAADPLDGAAAESPLALPDDLFDDQLS